MSENEKRLTKVAFTGPSGAGKTTAARYFGETTGFLALQGDELMFKGIVSHPEFAKRVYGRAPEPGETPNEFFFSTYWPVDLEKEAAPFAAFRPYIEEQLSWVFQGNNCMTDLGSHEIFENAVLFQPKNGHGGSVIKPNGIAIEMCGFHKAKHLARSTDFLFIVNSDPEQRKKMLSMRENMQQYIRMGVFDEIVAIREAVHSKLPKTITLRDRVIKIPTIINNYTAESLKNGQQKIVSTLKESGIEI